MAQETVQKIQKLANQLHTSPNVRDRRAAGVDLLSLLKKKDVRRKLIIESTPDTPGEDDLSAPAQRRKRLSQLWSVVVLSALKFVSNNRSGNKKSKLNEKDIALPYHLLVASDEPDGVFDNDNIAIPKLEKKDVNRLLNYCLDMLDNEEAVKLSETNMLLMLRHLCSKKEHLGYFSKSRYAKIFGEIFERLTPECEKETPSIFKISAEILEGIFRSCQEIGRQLDEYVPHTLQLIAVWCKESGAKRLHRSGALTELYNTVATVLFTHPDHSIGPLKRCGRAILSCCKKCYASSDAVQKDALNNYILSMLFVSQVAGDFQGLVTGDMGHLGKATMSNQHINDLLVLAMEDILRSLVFDDNHHGKRSIKYKWIKPDLKQQRQLEVVARLLAVAQRRYLAHTELSTMGEDAEDGLRKYLKIREDNSTKWVNPKAQTAKPCPPNIFADSPLVKHVIARLTRRFQRTAASQHNSGSELSTIRSDSTFEVLQYLQDPGHVPEATQVGLLAIICACGEMFPAGDCWSSMTGCESWLRVPSSSTDMQGGALHFHPSSLSDLQLLVATVADLLEANGGAGGNQTLQGWAMIALIRLSESFAAIHTHTNGKIVDYDSISETWRRVWKILVRTDLRYHVYTKVTTTNSLGELVLILLKNIVDMRCTDPQMILKDEFQAKRRSFMFENQHQVWALPTFGDFKKSSSISSLLLISSMLAVVGLSDAGVDMIDASLCNEIFPADDIRSVGRRKRLLSLSLGCLATWHRNPEQDGTNSVSLPFAIAALTTVALVNGTVGNSINEVIQSLISEGHEQYQCVKCTAHKSCSPFSQMRRVHLMPIEAAIKSLWVEQKAHGSASKLTHLGWDRSLAVARSIFKQVTNLRLSTSDGDFVPEAESNDLRTNAMKFFEARLTPISIEDDTADSMDLDRKDMDQSLSFQALGVKLRVTLCLSSSQGKLSSNTKEVVKEAANFFLSASMRLPTLKDVSQFSLLATELLHIERALLEISPLINSLADSDQVGDVVEQYKSMLLEYFQTHRQGIIGNESTLEENVTYSRDVDFLSDDEGDSVVPSRQAKNTADFSDDDDEDSDRGGASRKRKRRPIDGQSQSRKRPNVSHETTSGVPPNEESAMTVASILVALDPSSASCKLVCQALLGTELDFDPSEIGGDINLRMVPFCLNLVSSESAMFHSKARQLLIDRNESMETSQHDSVVRMLSNIVDMIRNCKIPSSPTWGMGSVECARAIEATKIVGTNFVLSETDMGHLIRTLEEEVTQNRPSLRAQNIASATLAFQAADALFHQKYDGHFVNAMKCALQDTSSAVRRMGAGAAVACLESLEKDRVVEAVMSALPPITELMGEETVTAEFSEWYKSSGNLASQVDNDLGIEIQDKCEAMESDAIFCQAILAGATRDVNHFREMLFGVVQISSVRPDLEYTCYRALERTAIMRRYHGVEELIESESASLLMRLVQAGCKRFPLVLTAPNIIRQAMTCGIAGCSDVISHSGQLSYDAEHIFANRHRSMLVPLLLIEIVATNTKMERIQETEILDAMLKNKTMVAVCEALSGDDDKIEVLLRLLKHHIPDIHAFLQVLLHSEESQHKDVADKSIEVLEVLLSKETVQERISNKRSHIIRRIFELCGNQFSDDLQLDVSRCFRAMITTLDSITDEKTLSGDKFVVVGMNATENLIHGFVQLDEANIALHGKILWSAIELQCKFIDWQMQSGNMRDIQFGFCVHILTEAMLKPNLAELLPEILGSLRMLLQNALKHMDASTLKAEVTPVMQRLIGACLIAHEACQQRLLKECRKRDQTVKQLTCRSCGLLALCEKISSDDAWGWEAVDLEESSENDTLRAIEKYCDVLDKEVCVGITNTYSVLEQIFESASSLELRSEHFLTTAMPYALSSTDLAALARFDRQFCAQQLARKFEAKQEAASGNMADNINELVKSLLSKLGDKQAWNKAGESHVNKSLKSSPDSSGSLNVDQRLLYAELLQLGKELQNGSLDGVENADLERTIRELSFVCGSFCPREIRVAASKCLAEMDSERLATLCNSESTDSSSDTLRDAFEKDQLLLVMQSRCIESLGERLKASDASKALVAAETASALFSTTVGKKCWSLTIDKKGNDVLSPFVRAQRRGNRPGSTLLTSLEVSQLKANLMSLEEGMLWCWDESFWKCGNDSNFSFREWICSLTTAIILCCFPCTMNDAGPVSEDAQFFWHCQRMSFLDAEFASRLFQCLIVRLLNTANSFDDTAGNVQALTASFTVLLSSNDSNASHVNAHITEALGLAIDTLHILFRHSMQGFLAQKHKPNQSRRDKHSSKKSPNENLRPPVPWRGSPYGVKLKLDGLVVARACIKAQRYASGLFFLDLHFDSQFGKAGGVLEDILQSGSTSFFRQDGTISGDISSGSFVTEMQQEQMKDSALAAMEVKAKCLEKLDEKEMLEALHIQMSALNFMESGSVGAHQNLGKSDPLETLRRLNDQSLTFGQTPNLPIQMSQCFGELGCHQVTQSYIEGVLSRHSNLQSLGQTNIEKLNEKWYEASLRLRQWDLIDDVQPITQPSLSQNSTQLTASVNESMHHISLPGMQGLSGSHGPGFPSHERGFFELLSRALDSFADEDMRSCLDFLAQGRLTLLGDLAHSGYGESPVIGIARRIDKLRAIRDVESIASKMQYVEDIPRIWDIEEGSSKSMHSAHHIKLFPAGGDADSMSVKGTEIDLHDFSSGIREIVLKSLIRKQGRGSDPFLLGILASHIGNLCVKAREGARSDIAEAALQRLHAILNVRGIGNKIGTKEYLQLQIRIEEAKVYEFRGDFSSAIRISKQVVDFLHRKQADIEHMDDEAMRLLADAQICCGTWMARHKVQQSKLVLDTYLRSGTERAQKIFEGDSTRENAERATGALLEFGQILSSLYEALHSRVTALEWKEASAALAHQEREFEKADKLREEADRRLSKVGNKHPKYAKYYNEWSELAHFCVQQEKEIKATKEERERIANSMGVYLIQSIKSFLSALSIADTGMKSDLSRHVFRLVSLWFSSSGEKVGDESVNELMRKGLERIPTFRFIPLIFQLVSRLEYVDENGVNQAKENEKGKESEFQSALQRLLFRMAADHPYHLLFPIIALSNGNRVESGRNAKDYLENVGDKKVLAASELLKRLKKEGGFVSKILESSEILAQSYIRLAHASTEKFHDQRGSTKGIRFSQVASPKDSRKSGVAALDVCLRAAECPPGIITSPPPVQPAGNYGDGIDDPIGAERIHRFESTFDITDTGIHRPKIVICIGTKGGRYRQLVKGDDDLRQDAVMTQVFRYVNGLMIRRDHSSRAGSRSAQQGLQMVTYNVSPLSPMSGVLEWVEDTIPFGNYEEDQRTPRGTKVAGAHSRLYPGEWSNSLCRLHLGESGKDERRRSFDEICKRHSPVFRFFFTERFGHNLQAWHAAKMRYTRSVAVSSIVGHVLGIGDRHCKNILVHEKKGVVVHIDFGIVFEQGKILSTPEQVPFRLTRNMIDGMGPLGVEGTFLKSAEETMAVLRKNADALLTILSAVVDDPLYKWSLSPVEARKRQKNDDDDDNGTSGRRARRASKNGAASDPAPTEQEIASVDNGNNNKEENRAGARALAKIKAKLQGYEDSTSGELHGIEGQIQVLVNLARDPDNLCKMFPGWSPWI